MQKYEHSIVTRESDKFQLRFPVRMRDQISKLAKENGRSMNAEMIDRLQKSFTGEANVLTDLIGRQNGLILLLSECVEQLLEIEPRTEADMKKIELIKSLYSKAMSKDLPRLLEDKT